jgi:serine protease Do
MDKPAGALVAEVEKGGPAERAGLLVADLIVELDGRPVQKADDATRIIASLKPGTVVHLRVRRPGASATLRVTTGEVAEESRGTRQP